MRLLMILIIVFSLPYIAFTQQENNEDKPPRGRDDNKENQTLTSEQRATVKSILSQYNAASLTADDAKAIHRALREAGLRGGRALNDAITEAGFDPQDLRRLDPPRGDKQKNGRQQDNNGQARDGKQKNDRRQGNEKGGSKYNIEQAMSDKAQLSTIAFSGLAFLTGDFGAATFIPPGKVCDFFGFQYMRDIDAAQKGHNPMFLNRVAGNVLHILNDEQKQMFLSLAEEQAPQLEALAKMRLPLINAFCLQRDNRLPAGSSGLNQQAVIRAVGEIFAMDARLSLRRAEVMAQVALSLTPAQKTYLGNMKFGDFNTWPALDERDKIRQTGRGKSKMFNVAYMTYASEFFSWTAGSVEADTYFCPERHGTYFGGFYMKDMPAMGKRDYDISTSVTGDSGEAFVNNVLTGSQRRYLTEIPDKQRKALQETVEVRTAISQELRKLLKNDRVDLAKVINLGRRYGELDGEMSWYYTMAFANINRTLTAQQRIALNKLRNLEGYKSAPYYIYSEAMKSEPELKDVDSFFFAPKQSSNSAK